MMHFYPERSERVNLRYAILDYTHQYAQWTGLWQWRKPPEWVGGYVKLHRVRRGPMFVPEMMEWRRELQAKLERSLRERDRSVQ